MLSAVKYLGKVRAGITAPQLFRADDRKVYVVKFQNNIIGPKVLVSEFLAAKMGEMLGLCFPFSDIISIDDQILKESPSLINLGACPGKHFASQYLNHTKYLTKKNMHQACNIAEMAGVVLFDHFFHNADRTTNEKNLLLRSEKDQCKIYAIDNSHLFRSGRWTKESLAKLANVIRVYYRFSYGRLLKDFLSPQDFLPYSEKISQISDEQIFTLIAGIPSEWLPEESERIALIDFIHARAGLWEKIMEEICKHIPKARGGKQWWGGK